MSRSGEACLAYRSEDQLEPNVPTHYVQWRMFSKSTGGTLTCTVKNRELEPVPLEFEGVACSPNFEA
jgi:hypothetical protein